MEESRIKVKTILKKSHLTSQKHPISDRIRLNKNVQGYLSPEITLPSQVWAQILIFMVFLSTPNPGKEQGTRRVDGSVAGWGVNVLNQIWDRSIKLD